MKKIIRLLLLLILITGSICVNLFAQAYADFQSLMFPRSLASAGFGEQGVALKSGLTAMQYNPANLVYIDGVNLSYFRNPWNFIGFASFPLTATSCLINLGSLGSIGLEYTYWDFGEVITTTTSNPSGGEKYHFYERTIAGGYAISLSDKFAVGAQVRYIWKPFNGGDDVKHLLFSAGITYSPEIFTDRVTLGLSLMNFGTPIKYEIENDTINRQLVEETPPPAHLNIGLSGIAVESEFHQINLSLGVKKPFDKTSGHLNYSAQSSFKSLFNDWDDFPNDMTIQTGVGFIWKPIYLGAGISFMQEMYVGYFSTGPKDAYGTHASFYTHGLKAGLSASGVQATIGYAGRWHNNNANNYIQWKFPWETFQFELNTNVHFMDSKKDDIVSSSRTPKNIILSGGYLYPKLIGKMKEIKMVGAKMYSSSTPIWLIEADFYIDDNSAIFTLFDYSRLTYKLTISSYEIKIGIETFSLESGFRYHPIEIFSPLFIQMSLGIIRMNPVLESTSPRYFYNSYTRIVAGLQIPIFDSIILMPKFGLRTVFMEENSNQNRVGGYNQYEFGINVGYKL